MKANCDCIEGFNKQLAKYNTKLSLCLFLDGGAVPYVATEKVQTKQRNKARTVLPSFCPFCGVEYDREPAYSSAQSEKR